MGNINPVNKSFCLEQVCETNYQKLFRLIPGLMSFDHYAVGYSGCKPALHLRIIERAPYTITLELSHCFDDDKPNDFFLEPAVKIRLYLDARQAEVIRDHARSHVYSIFKDPGQSSEILDYKWSLNFFLQKWLDHCLQTDYRFETVAMDAVEA